MQRVLFLTNYPSPYRVHFFDILAKNMDVTVLFTDRAENKKHRNSKWYAQGDGSFRAVHLQDTFTIGSNGVCLEVIRWLKKENGHIIICGYSNPTMILAMAYLRLRRIPFYMEVDGGLIRQEGRLKYLVKKSLVSMAPKWLSTGSHTSRYLTHYGAKEDQIAVYPFSSLYEKDILPKPLTREEKKTLRMTLEIPEKNMILAIGQFIHRKGFDVLLQAAASVAEDTGIYIVGGLPEEAYLKLRDSLGLKNIHFLDFQNKDRLSLLYQAADLFVLPTREDIWGLVINEAMGYGLPVITTDRCVAGLELIEDGINGYIVPVGDAGALAEKINAVLATDMTAMGAESLEKIRPYTLENMAKTHQEILENGR